jgi:hypothetical protein
VQHLVQAGDDQQLLLLVQLHRHVLALALHVWQPPPQNMQTLQVIWQREVNLNAACCHRCTQQVM